MLMRLIPAPMAALGLVFALILPTVAGEPSLIDLEALAWMEGTWLAREGKVEEIWTDPKDGLILGMNRDTSRPNRPFFEYLRLEKREDGIFYVASPRGGAPTAFKLVKRDGDTFVFENPEHDFPQRITYTRKDSDAMCAAIGYVDPEKTKTISWCYHRK